MRHVIEMTEPGKPAQYVADPELNKHVQVTEVLNNARLYPDGETARIAARNIAESPLATTKHKTATPVPVTISLQ